MVMNGVVDEDDNAVDDVRYDCDEKRVVVVVDVLLNVLVDGPVKNYHYVQNRTAGEDENESVDEFQEYVIGVVGHYKNHYWMLMLCN